MVPAAAFVPLARSAGMALARSAPAIRERAMKLIAKATGGRVSSVDDAVTYAQRTRNNLAVVAINSAKAGVEPALLFPSQLMSDVNDKGIAALNERVRAAFSAELSQVDSSSIIRNNKSDEERTLHTQIVADIADRLGLRTKASIRAFHVEFKMFMAMDEATIASVLNVGTSAKRLPAS